MSAAPGHQLCDVESGYGDRQQTYGSQYRETSAHVVGDDEALITFLVGCGACRAFLCIGYGHDDFACHIFSALVFALLLEQAECQCRFGSGTALGYIDYAEFLVFEVVAHLGR